MTPRAGLVCAALLITASPVAAQPAPTLGQLLDRMRDYLVEYETQLSSVVADVLSSTADAMSQARAIAEASAEHRRFGTGARIIPPLP